MSSSDRRQFLTLLAALPLAACGFTPAYAPGTAGDRLRGRVAVRTPATRDDFMMTSRLESRLGRAEAAAYDLAYTLTIENVSGGISRSNEITRYTVRGSVTFTLTERASGTRIDGGTLRNFTSWSATGSTVAGLAAAESARARVVQLLADDIVTRLIAGTP